MEEKNDSSNNENDGAKPGQHYVFLIQNEVYQDYKNGIKLKIDFNRFKIFSLNHPRNLKPSKFALLNNEWLCEIQREYKGTGSWFIDKNIVEDGGLYFCTICDPLFVLLPRLFKCRQKNDQESERGVFVPTEHIFYDDPEYQILFNCKNSNLNLICDSMDMAGEKLYRVNDDKVMKWLLIKTKRIASKLKNHSSFNMELQSDTAEGFVLSRTEKEGETYSPSDDGPNEKNKISKNNSKIQKNDFENLSSQEQKDYYSIALSIILEYISDELLLKLAKQLDMDGNSIIMEPRQAPLFHNSVVYDAADLAFRNGRGTPRSRRRRGKGEISSSPSSSSSSSSSGNAPKRKLSDISGGVSMSRGAAKLARTDKSKNKSITSFFTSSKKK